MQKIIKELLESKSIEELWALSIYIEQLIEKKRDQGKEVPFDTYLMEVVDLIKTSGHTSLQAGLAEWGKFHPGKIVCTSSLEDVYRMARLAVLWAYDYKRNPETADEFYATEYEHSIVCDWESTH